MTTNLGASSSLTLELVPQLEATDLAELLSDAMTLPRDIIRAYRFLAYLYDHGCEVWGRPGYYFMELLGFCQPAPTNKFILRMANAGLVERVMSGKKRLAGIKMLDAGLALLDAMTPSWDPENRELLYEMYGQPISALLEHQARTQERSQKLANWLGKHDGAVMSRQGMYGNATHGLMAHLGIGSYTSFIEFIQREEAAGRITRVMRTTRTDVIKLGPNALPPSAE